MPTYDQSSGTTEIRASMYDPMVKQIAERLYKFKQALKIESTSAWTHYYYQEDPTELAGRTGNTGSEIPRGARFPSVSVTWDQQVATMKQYGMEDTLFWSDLISSEINVRERTTFKLAKGVTKFVDDGIWTVLTESLTPVNIQTFTITHGYQWDTASAAIIDDLERAEQLIAENNYDTSKLMVFISPKDKRKIVNYLYEKGAQTPQIATRVVDDPNGVIGSLGNKTFIVSNSVTASYALVVVPQVCATGRALEPLKTITKIDEGRNMLVRSWEYFVSYITDPKAIVLIKNTQSP